MNHPSIPIKLILENIRSAHNVGAIFRTADAVGIEEIILGPLCPIPPRADIEKTALGATLSVSWRQERHLPHALQELQKANYHSYALEQSSRSVNLLQTHVSFPLILIVGHEREGVSPELLTLCSTHLHLPMRGRSAHSLNVSTAAAVALYELGRRFWYA